MVIALCRPVGNVLHVCRVVAWRIGEALLVLAMFALPAESVDLNCGTAPQFVCEPCGSGQHVDCRGSTWCDCQHGGSR